MTDPTTGPALPVDVEGTVELAPARPSPVQLIAVAALALGLLLCLGGVIACALQGITTPAVLDVTLGAIAGALARGLPDAGRH